MSNNLIGLCGNIASGKDTVFKIIQSLDGEYHPNLDENKVNHISSMIVNNINVHGKYVNKKNAKLVKEIATHLTGVATANFENQEFKKHKLPNEWVNNKLKIYTWRDFLIHLGTGLRDVLNENVWVNAAYVDYKPTDFWVFTDVRFKNEANRVRELGGKLIRIERIKPLKDWLIFYNLSFGSLDDNTLNMNLNQVEFRNEIICEIENFFKSDEINSKQIKSIKNILFSQSETDLEDYDKFDRVIINDSDLNTLIYRVNKVLK